MISISHFRLHSDIRYEGRRIRSAALDVVAIACELINDRQNRLV